MAVTDEVPLVAGDAGQISNILKSTWTVSYN